MQINTLDGSNPVFRGRLSRGYRAVRFVLILVQSSPSVLSCPRDERRQYRKRPPTQPGPPATPARKAAEKTKRQKPRCPGKGGPRSGCSLAVPSPGPCLAAWPFPSLALRDGWGKRELLCYHVFYCTTVRKYNTKVQKYKSTYLTTRLN